MQSYPMLPGRASWAGTLAVLYLLVVSQPASASKGACREVQNAFEDGIWSFERKDWGTTVERMHEAMVKAPECTDPSKLRSFVPYGRWVYPFTPEVYLGVALSQLSGCTTESVQTAACRMTVDLWWRDLDSSGQSCLAQSPPAKCSESAISGRVECGPAPDWWQSLSASKAEVKSSVADYDDECGELWGMMSIFREVFLRRKNNNRETCSHIVAELKEVLGECSDIDMPRRWLGAAER